MSDLVIGFRVAGSQLESFGSALVGRVGLLNLWTAALLGGALVLDRALSRRARASLRVLLYAPVALRVVLPLDWHVGLVRAPRIDALLAPLAQIGPGTDASRPGSPAPSWHALAAVVYVAVMVFLAARAVVARRHLSLALHGSSPVQHVTAPCPVVEHDELGPMAVGLLAPRIVVPRRLLAPGQEGALACVLRHEAAHLRRGDAWLSLGMQVLAVAAWPVVPVWLAVARVRQLVELACDEAALSGADASERRRYGHALLDVAERSLAHAPLAAGELHFGSTLRARIEALATQRHWPLAAQALTLCIAPIALFVACGGAAQPPAVPTTGASVSDAEGYGYEFDTDSAKAAASEPAKMLPTGADGRIPPETIQTTVRAHFAELRACYDAGLRRDPKLAGIVNVRFVFGVDGVTRDAADDHSTLPDAQVVACAVDVFRRITYPKADGGSVTVVYPIRFAP